MGGIIPYNLKSARIADTDTGEEAWTPADLGSALIGWYKADAGVYIDAGSTLATNGQYVRQWNDQSGTGNHLTQETIFDNAGPTFNTGILNGLPGLVYSDAGTGTWLANQAISLGGTTASVFIVVKSTYAGALNGRFIEFTATGDGNDYGTAGSAVFLFARSATNVAAYRHTDLLSGGTIVDDTFAQIGSIFDGANNTVYIDGVGQTPVPNSDTFGATGSFAVGSSVLSPPGSTTSDAAVNGTICEIIFTNTALDETDRALLQAYFTARWGV